VIVLSSASNPVPAGHQQTPVNFPSKVVTLAEAQAGVQFAATAVGAPSGTTYSYQLSYYTDNTAGATVTPSGLVTASSLGTARVNVVATIPGNPNPTKVSMDATLTVVSALPSADTSALEVRVGAVEDAISDGELDSSDYTTSTWSSLQNALNNANTVINSGTATEAQVASAQTAIENALNNLVVRGDPAQLAAALAVVSALTPDSSSYTYESWRAVSDAAFTAQAYVNSPGNVSQAQMTTAANNLNSALAGLILKPLDTSPTVAALKSTLGTEVTSLSKLNSVDYTPASWAALQSALAGAQAVATNSSATLAQVQGAIASLTDAVSGLVFVPKEVEKVVEKVVEVPGSTVQSTKATVKSITVAGKAFKKGTKPKLTVTIKLSSGTPKGRVAIFVGGKKVKTFNAIKTKTTVTLPKKYSKSIKVRVKYNPTSSTYGSIKYSATKTIKVK
jgi:hypothetical protein